MTAEAKRPQAGSPIVRADHVAAWREGERYLQRARDEANTLMQHARAQASAVREQARREGFEAGLAAGREEAAAQAVSLTAERDAYLRGMARPLAHAIDAGMRSLLDDLDNTRLVAAVARKAIDTMREPDRLVLRVPPGMIDTLQRDALLDGLRGVTLREDAGLRESECLLETPLGNIELSPHAQWRRIFAALCPADGAPC